MIVGKWVTINVLVPLLGPVLLAAIVVLLSQANDPDFQIDFWLIFDITPTALTFYGIALISGSLTEFWRHIGDHAILGIAAIIMISVTAINYAILVLNNHDPAYDPAASATYLALGLACAAIVVSAMCKRVVLKAG